MVDILSRNETNQSSPGFDASSFLYELHKERVHMAIPAIVMLIILAATGVIGNTLVIVVYYKGFQRTPSRGFIMYIALFDLVANLIGIPGELYNLFYSWVYESGYLCRLFTYSNVATTDITAAALLALAIARYLKICRPFGKQVTEFYAKIICICITIFGMTTSIPHGVTFGVFKIPIKPRGVVISVCSLMKEYNYPAIWPHILFSALLIFFTVMCIAMVVVYVLIGVKAYKQSKIHHKLVTPSSTDSHTPTCTSSTNDEYASDSTELDSNKYDIRCRHAFHRICGKQDSNNKENLKGGCNVDTTEKNVDEQFHKSLKNEEDPTSSDGSNDIEMQSSSNKSLDINEGDSGYNDSKIEDCKTETKVDVEEIKLITITEQSPIPLNSQKQPQQNQKQQKPPSQYHKRHKIINRTTAMLMIITLVYVVSYFPLIVYAFIGLANPLYFENMSKVTTTGWIVLRRMYFINSAANAFIYSICDVRFRNQLKHLFRKCTVSLYVVNK